MSDTRNTGDAWVTARDGNRYWGTFGAAGLLAHDHDLGILLQHRVDWSDHGGTWGIPGGALHENETPVAGALRESHEEASVPSSHVKPTFSFVLDRGEWQYTTVLAEVTEPFSPQITDPESHELRWVAIDKVNAYPLHPAFAASWEELKAFLGLDPLVILDCTELADSKHLKFCPNPGATSFEGLTNLIGVHPGIFGFTHQKSASSNTLEIKMVFPEFLCAASLVKPDTPQTGLSAGYQLAREAQTTGRAVILVTPNAATQQQFQIEGGIAVTPTDFSSSASLPSH